MAVLAQVLELLSLQIEHGGLIVFLGRWKIERIAQAGRNRQPIGDFPVVLDEILLKPRAGANLLPLYVDREGLDLTEQKAGERRSGVGHARQIGKEIREDE